MKRFIKIVLLGFCIGIISVVIQNMLHIDSDVFLRYYWIAAVVIVLLILVLNIGYNFFYFKKIKNAIKLLEMCKPQEYVEIMEQLLQKAKGKGLKNLLRLNLTAGYCDLKEYEKALAVLEDMNHIPLKNDLALVHHLNLCICYFYTGQTEKAMALYQKPKESFSSYVKHPDAFRQHFLSLDILAAIAERDFEKADKLLNQAEETWHDLRSQKLYAETRNTLYNMKKEINP